jgi:hypothetical protein
MRLIGCFMFYEDYGANHIWPDDEPTVVGVWGAERLPPSTCSDRKRGSGRV